MNGTAVATQSEQDRLPNGWRWVRLGDICEIGTGGTPDTTHSEYYGGNVLWLKSGDIKGIYISDTSSRITELGLANSNAQIYPAGTVVVALSGQGKTRGTSGILATPCACSQSVAALLPSSRAIPEIVHFALVHLYEHVRRITGDNERTGLNLRIMRDITIPLPPLPEQKRIAVILKEQTAAVERARRSAEAQLQAAENLPAAYLRAVFCSPHSQEWPRRSLREISVENGQYGTSVATNPLGTGTAVLRMGNINGGRLIWDDLKYISLPDTDVKKYLLRKGDVLFNRTNSAELVGKAAVFDGSRDAVFASYLIRFRLDEAVADPAFVTAYINSGGREFIKANMARAIGQVNISASTMHRMPIPVPPINSQRQIVAQLSKQISTTERIRSTLKTQLETVSKLPAALLRRAFSGEL